MKQSSSFFLARWWNGIALHNRLYLPFTVMFLYCVLSLSGFLYMGIRLVSINYQARSIFEQNRSFYDLWSFSKQYELALNNYEINSSVEARMKLRAIESQIDDTVVKLRAGLEGDDLSDLETFAISKAKVQEQFVSIMAAVDAEDWEQVSNTDDGLYDENNGLIYPMFDAIDRMLQRGWDNVDALEAEKESFTQFLRFSLVMSIILVLLLAGVVTLVVHTQINGPLAMLGQAAQKILAGNFHPDELAELTGHLDEVGYMAREMVVTTQQVELRSEQISKEIAENRAKIR